MPGPDGPEEREQWREEAYERDLDEIELREMLADECEGDESAKEVWP